MTRILGVALLALALSFPALASAGKKQHVPGQIVQARYVCLGYDVGDGFLSENDSISTPHEVFPEDRQILNAVRGEIEKWGKYVITVRPEQAQLLIAVRAGRVAGFTGGVGVGSGGRTGVGVGANQGMGGVQFSTPYDTFTIYESRGGRAGAQLWRVQKKGALAGSPPQAFQDFKVEVERAPTSKPAEPAGETAVPEASEKP